MKKTLCLVLSLIMLLSCTAMVSGCEKNDVEQESDNAETNADVETNYTVVAYDDSPTDGIKDKLVSLWDDEHIIDGAKKGTLISKNIFGKELEFTYDYSHIPLYDWEYVDVYTSQDGKSLLVKNGKTVGYQDNSREFVDRQITLETPEELSFPEDADKLHINQKFIGFFEKIAKGTLASLGIEEINEYMREDSDSFSVSDFHDYEGTVVKKYEISFARALTDGVTNGFYFSNDRFVVTVTEKGEIQSIYAANPGSFEGYEIDGINFVPLYKNNLKDFKEKVEGKEYKESKRIVTKTPDGEMVLCETVDVYNGVHTGKYMIIMPIEQIRLLKEEK